MKRCGCCGAENPDGASFCNLCMRVFEPEPPSLAPAEYPGPPVPPVYGYAERSYPAVSRVDTRAYGRVPRVGRPPEAMPRIDRQTWRALWGAAIFTVIVLALSLVYAVFFRQATPEPFSSPSRAAVIDVTAEPVQAPADDREALYRREGEFEIQPLASYVIQGRVLDVAVNNYYGAAGSVFPVDVAIVWGKTAETDYDRYMKYSFDRVTGENQWLTVMTGGVPLPEGMTDEYIMTHLSNNHVLPASENLYNALVRLDKHDEILLDGYLVRAVLDDGRVMESSLVRDDTEGGACECIYLESLQVGDEVYE